MEKSGRVLRCVVAAGLVAGVAGCNGIGINAAISECGGFKSTSRALVTTDAGVVESADVVEPADAADVVDSADVADVVEPADDYGCGPGRLILSVDRESGVVHYTHENVEFNCCGDREIKVEKDGGKYFVYEDDSPEGSGIFGGARCNCYCLFDFSVDIPIDDFDQISLKVITDASDDDEPPDTRFDGVVDISSGSVTLVISAPVGPLCY